MHDPILRLEGLSKYYTGTNSVVVGLSDLSLSFRAGEFVAITGESGSGKSTLAHVLGGILPYESGELFFRGKPTSHFDSIDYQRYRRDHISFISQSYGILPGCTVLENVVSALRLSGMEKPDARVRAEEILRQVELWELRTRRAAKLSSGQKQRLSIARALAKPAPILIADEPTGNLDPENSEKIMDLLSQAAKDRLVILITHEFSEAEGRATRHIALQDGKVILDTPLRPQAEPASREIRPTGKKKALSGYVSRLQLMGRPVWSALVLAFFALTAFAVFAFLGTFIIAADDTNTRIYDPSAFRNGSRTRIVVTRPDGAPMTDGDYSAILDMDYVTALERHDYLMDVNYGYREDVDYKWNYTAVDKGSWDDPDVSLSSRATLTGKAGFLKTVPLLPQGQEFLTAGRLPEKLGEVVLAGSESLIGTKLPVFIQDVKTWNISSLISFQVEIVGVTDFGSGLYFHEDLGRAFTHYGVYGNRNWFYLPCEELLAGEARLSKYYWEQSRLSGKSTHFLGTLILDDPSTYTPENHMTLNHLANHMAEGEEGWRQPWHDSMFNAYCQVSQEDFEKLVWQQPSDQVSITIADYAYTDRVLKTLSDAGYIAVSPFREGSTEVDPELAQERKQTLTVCAAALAAVIALQVIVLRALFGTQTEGYRLLSNIGLTCSAARHSILWQILLFTVLGQLLGLGLLTVCNALGVERIVYVMRYLPPVWMLLLGAVHLAAALGAAVWVMGSMTRQVFPLDRKEADLELEEVTA